MDRRWRSGSFRRGSRDGQRPVGREAAPGFLDTTVALEKKFRQGRQNRAEELESAVRYFLEFLKGFPVILMGSDFWPCMKTFFEESLLVERTIDPQDAELFQITDSPEEAVAIITRVEHQDTDGNPAR